MLFPEMVFVPVVMTSIPVEMTFLSAVIMFAPTEVTLFAHGGDFSAENDFISKISSLMTSLQQPPHFYSITSITVSFCVSYIYFIFFVQFLLFRRISVCILTI